MTAALMFMGTGSGVGKSLLVAGLCRLLANQGVAVCPFKPQNMSNNAAVTPQGGEIGRAQAVQAQAARVPPCVHMNPVLLKPQPGQNAQVILQGRHHQLPAGQSWQQARHQMLGPVLDSFHQLAGTADLILVEGAGSASEVNMRRGDIANMGFAAAADLPVVMIGDIERGGVIAALAGTKTVLEPTDAARIVGFCINKFCGDPGLFADGMRWLEHHTGWAGLGIVPWFEAARLLPAEDMMDLASKAQTPAKASAADRLHICVPILPGIANFDDLDPLLADPGLRVTLLTDGQALPAECDLVILPGSKSTLADLQHLYDSGWASDIIAHARRGGAVLGICGGYQMLGRQLHDPLKLESRHRQLAGLGLLDVETVLRPEKTLQLTRLMSADGQAEATGYEIHLGQTSGPDCKRPFLTARTRQSQLPSGHGALSPDGRIAGCYLHGLFDSAAFRNWYFAHLGRQICQPASEANHQDRVEGVLDQLADHLAVSLDIDRLVSLARPLAG